jgi:p-aminobenzoyl-glutamate transporter AbgT
LFLFLTIHSKVSFVLSAFLDNDFVGTSCESTSAGLFIMINSLLLIVVNNPARVDCKNPFGIIDLSNTLSLFYISLITSIYEFHVWFFLCQIVAPLVLSWVRKITKATDGKTSRSLTKKKKKQDKICNSKT